MQFVQLPAPAGNGSGTAVDVSGLGPSKTVIWAAGFDANVAIQASGDGGSTWEEVLNAANPTFRTIPLACTHMRMHVSNRKGATVPIVHVGGEAVATQSAAVVPGTPGTGVDISTMGGQKTVIATEFTGPIEIQISDDNVKWAPFHTFNGAGVYSHECYAQLMRAVTVGDVEGTPSISVCAADDPAQASGGVPTPAYVPFDTPIKIYARTTGNDATGNGTLANPYRTFQRAIRDVPVNIFPNTRYTVDITDLGTELLPEDFTLPPFNSAGYESVDFGSDFFLFAMSVNIQADPQLFSGIPAGDAVVNAGVITADAKSGVKTVTIGAPRASWANDALKGAIVMGAGGAAGFEMAVVVSSSTTTIEVSTGAALTFPIQIMEQSATLQGQIGPDGFLPPGGFNILGTHDIEIGGINFPEALLGGVTGNGYPGLAVGGQFCALLESCRVEYFDEDYGGRSINKGCYFTYNQTTGSFFPFNCVFDGFFNYAQQSFIEGGLGCFGCTEVQIRIGTVVTDGIVFGNRTADPPGGTTAFFRAQNFEIRDAVGDGVAFQGTNGLLKNGQISNFVDNGVNFSNGHGVLEVDNVGGTGATGSHVGLRANDGAYIKVGTGTDVSGDDGDVKSGDLAVAAYGALPQYDITAVGAGGATGTGSRIYAA